MPIGLSDVEDPTFSRQSVHRWRRGCQPYAPAALYPPPPQRQIPGIQFCYRLSQHRGHSAAGTIRSTDKLTDLIGIQTHNLPTCSMVPELATLRSAPKSKAIPVIDPGGL
jgi:hypothetical protein